MSPKGLSVSEALALFEEFPSNTDSIISNDSTDTEEYSISDVIEFDINDGSTQDDEEDELNMPGPSQPIFIRWKKRSVINKTVPDFDSETGPSEEILNMDDHSPIAIFLALFSVQFMESIVFQSNIYATQLGKSYTSLTLQEFYLFLAINFAIGVKRLLS